MMMKWICNGALSAASGNASFLEKLWDAFYTTFIAGETTYENLNIGEGSMMSVKNLIIGLFIGLSIAGFSAVFNKRVLGSFVRKLLYEECLSPESAKTLGELGYLKNSSIRYGVTRGVNLRRVVRCREEEEALEEETKAREEYEKKREEDPSLPKYEKLHKDKSFKVDATNHHFYIPAEMKYMADVKFEQKGTTWLSAVAFVIAMMIFLVVVLLALPYILELLNDLVGAFSSQNQMLG